MAIQTIDMKSYRVPPIGPQHRPLVLASSSPRRIQLLTEMGLSFTTASPDIDESVLSGESALAMVARLAKEKAAAIASRADFIGSPICIVAADTTVALSGAILGKPGSYGEAAAMLRSLSGRAHQVYTGMCCYLCQGHISKTEISTTEVTFKPLDEPEIKEYVSSGIPMDKAGSYAIQGEWTPVASINGSFTNVMGLDLDVVANLLKALDVIGSSPAA